MAMAHPARLRVMMRGVEEFHREISAKAYRYMRPGLEQTPWGALEAGAIDPFGNLIRFCELVDSRSAPDSGFPLARK
jgi:Glyoxalase superfamily protein